MFEANSLSATYHLQDLEREFTPCLQDYRPARTEWKFAVAAVLVVIVLAGVTLGAVPMV
jgi:hypothetical protein